MAFFGTFYLARQLILEPMIFKKSAMIFAIFDYDTCLILNTTYHTVLEELTKPSLKTLVSKIQSQLP